MTDSAQKKVLVVEDDADFAAAIEKTLFRSGLVAVTAHDVKTASQLLAKETFDLVLLDIELPDRSGLDLFMEMNESVRTSSIPVFFVTGRSGDMDKVTAFSMGAEDYVVKPFSALELQARVEAKLRKTEAQNRQKSWIQLGDLSLDSLAFRAAVRSENEIKQLDLGVIEFKLLALLASSPDRVFTREQLLDRVWGAEVNISDRAVDVHVCGLRKKLGPMGKCIETVTGAGYRMVRPENVKKSAA